MSKSLIKLIEYSLMPAALLIIGKIAGIFVSIRLFDIPLTTKEYANQLFSPVVVSNPLHLLQVTSFSDLTMFVVIATYFSIALIRAIYLHNTHVKPPLVAKLVKYNLLSLVQNSYELYHNAFVSLIFTWIATILIVVNVLNSQTYGWIAISSSLVTFALTLGLFYDVYREIEQIRKSPGKYEWI